MSASDPSLVQLIDMGIPRSRAKAALIRSKGDVMAAAERVFGGDFDDIPSDDEGDAGEEASTRATSLQTDGVSEQGRRINEVIVISDDGGDSDGIEIMDEDDDDDDEGMLYEDDGNAEYFDMEEEGQTSMMDPYAGVFFSKERTERIMEPILEVIEAKVPTPSVDGKTPKSATSNVRVLSRGEWMSGCPEGGEQSFLFQLYNTLAEGEMACAQECGHKFKRDQTDFFALFPTFPQYTAHLARIVPAKCPNCATVTCRACGETMKIRSAGKGKASENSEIEALFHCPNLQGAMIGVGLHTIEQAFNPALAEKPSPPVSEPVKKKRKIKSVVGKFLPSHHDDGSESDADSEYGGPGKSSAAKGTGYSGNTNEDRSGQLKAEEDQREQDAKTATLLSQVAVYLPSVKRGRTTDVMVHPTALAHLRRRSGFVNDLLRNDSLMDMSSRESVYRALLDWLEVVSSNESLASMLAMPQMRPVLTEPGDGPDTVLVTYEGSSSPRELLESVSIQATAALKGLSATTSKIEEPTEAPGMPTPAPETPQLQYDAQNVALKDFCERILRARNKIDELLTLTKGSEFVTRMQESLPRLHSANNASPVEAPDGSQETAIKVYEEWATRVRFQYCKLANPSDPTGISFLHAYDAAIQRLVGMDAPKRSLAIAKELAILTTNLPTAWGSTIFLRVDEDRVDCIKAMIIGPEGTPYENGCFIFDIFLPFEYNHGCPQVKSMTTNGGKYRYNPNLYADGKVCLSLLGTWNGPGWISGQSTLLQVLISIQSLILCDEPYLNEPGWADQGGSAASKAYSANVRRMVLADAMRNNLKAPPFPFEHEIKTHFRLKANAIRGQIDKWKALDDGKATEHDGAMTATASVGSSSRSSGKGSFDAIADSLLAQLDLLAPPPPPKAMGTPKRNPGRAVKRMLSQA